MTGAILAGGHALRFGGAPKGLLRVGERRIIDRVADALRPHCSRLLLIANDERAAQWLPDADVARDVRPGLGSLGGLHAAIVHANGPVLVTAWDMPFVTASLIGLLLAHSEDADAVVLESDSPYGFEPLCAWYAPTALPILERGMDDGELRASGIHAAIPRLHRVPRADVAALGDPATLFLSVNTPGDLARAQALAA